MKTTVAVVLKRMSLISSTAPVIARARTASPASVSRFETRTRCSLSRWRNSSRWFAVGAIRSAVESAVQSSTPK